MYSILIPEALLRKPQSCRSVCHNDHGDFSHFCRLACRACNLAEDVVPGENELYYLINEPMRYMEEYGDGIYAVIGGGDPYEAFEACQAAVNE